MAMYQIGRLTILLFTTFLLLFFSILINLIRLMISEPYKGTAFWTGAFMIPMLIFFHIMHNINNLSNVSFYLITVIFLISNLMLYMGWEKFYQEKISLSFYLAVIIIFSGITVINFFTSFNSEIVVDAVNVFILFSLIIFLYRKYREKDNYSSGIIILLNITALFMRLLPFITDMIQSKTISFYRELQLIEELSIPIHLSLLMLAIYLAIMNKLRVDFKVIINEKEVLLEKLEYQTMTDPLTQINNRRGFQKVINYEFLQNKRRNTGFTITICDIDFFKKVNDTYGHECGDIVIRKAAETISSATREQDTVARWGGEEFIILMLNCSTEQAAVSVERIRSEIENLKIKYKDSTISFTMSFGISESRKDDEDINSIIIRADRKLYRAKESGRNCIIC